MAKTLLKLGLKNLGEVYWNLTTVELYEQIIRRREGMLAQGGPMVVRTGEYTGRSPNDKFIVREPSSENNIWWGKANVPFDADKFELVRRRQNAFLQNMDVFVQDCYVGADKNHRLPIRVINQYAWHNLFARTMFLQDDEDRHGEDFKPEFTVIHTPGFHAEPDIDGTRSEAFVLVNFAERLVLIGGTLYGGEIKKSIFSIMNYLLPLEGVLSMHCSANIGDNGSSAVFFGLSGTGKTTLSADPERELIGDDEHGWSDEGVFNFEGGCYAKMIRLSKQSEPEIYGTTSMFGTVLENVVIDQHHRTLDLNDDTFTENTRGAYPITHIPNHVPSGKGPHPKSIVMLTCDAFGVLPPLSRMTPAQAMFHFVSGYTAKVAGTERGITEPQATFSTCFGAPFMALHPRIYAGLLGKRIREHDVDCWLINTGWTGGPHGVGKRISIEYTREIVHAALGGKLDDVEFVPDPIFKVGVPKSCPGVPSEVLDPKSTWTDKEAFDKQAEKLAEMFRQNFKQFEADVPDEVRQACP